MDWSNQWYTMYKTEPILEMCTQQTLAQANDLRIQIFAFSPRFKKVESDLKPNLPVVMATLNQFNLNLFCVFSKQ